MPQQSKKQPLISWILLCGNLQRDSIAGLTLIDAWGSRQKRSYEIMALSSHTDRTTRESLHRYTACMTNARYIESKSPHEGVEIQHNILEANGLIRIVITDTRCASVVQEYEVIESQFRLGADVVILYPQTKHSIMYQLIRSCTGLPYLYTQGVIAYSQKAAYAIFPHTKIRSRSVMIESLIYARQHGLRVHEVASTILPTGSIQSYKEIRDSIGALVGMWINKLRSRYDLKKYE